jgi:hypothetical protein
VRHANPPALPCHLSALPIHGAAAGFPRGSSPLPSRTCQHRRDCGEQEICDDTNKVTRRHLQYGGDSGPVMHSRLEGEPRTDLNLSSRRSHFSD